MSRFHLNRRLARLRQSHPLSLFVPTFLLGQVLALLLAVKSGSTSHHFTWICCASILICLILLWRWSSKVLGCLIAGFLLGALTELIYLLPQQKPLPRATTFIARVIGEPRYRRVGEVSFLADAAPFIREIREDAVQVALTTRVWCKGIHLPWRNLALLEQESVFVFNSSLKPIRPTLNPFAYDTGLFRQGIHATCKVRYASIPLFQHQGMLERLRQRIEEIARTILGEGEASGLFLSMTIGTRDMLSDQTEQAFKLTGLTHILVVSGFQVSLIFYCSYFLLRFVCLKISIMRRYGLVEYACISLASIFGVSYAMMTGIDGSSLRASLALIIGVGTKLFETRGGLGQGILVSLFCISVIWPSCILDPGVELTYAALCGIYLGTEGKSANSIVRALAVCFYCSLATSSVCLFWFGTLSLLAPLLNISVGGFIGAFSAQAGFITLALAMSGIDVAGVGMQWVAQVLLAFRDLVLWVSSLPFCAIQCEEAWQKVALLIPACCILSLRAKRVFSR